MEKDRDSTRALRLLRIVQEIRRDPQQSREGLIDSLGIGKSQFYKDRDELASLGFRFGYSKVRGFTIEEDRLSPMTDLTLSDRVILMFALQHLNACGEGGLAAMALSVARKLAGGLEQPLREQLTGCFDTEVTSKGFGVSPEVWDALQKAVADGRHINILYESAHAGWTAKWRRVYPRRLYFNQRTLYMYARDLETKPPVWKVFRLSRVKEVRQTGVCQSWRPDEDDGFKERQRNAFLAFIGENAREVKVHFTGDAAKYVKEQKWHETQRLDPDGHGGLFFTVTVAEPEEVARWAQQFGKGVEVLP